MATEKTTTKKIPARKASTKKKGVESAVKKETVPKTHDTLQAPVYDVAGKKVRDLALPKALFGASKNDALVYQVVTAMQANARTPIAHTKTRGDVRGGGRKPWKQKGTGRARHGSRRSPIWRGGGIALGPRNEKSYVQKINKKMRARALAAVLSQKLAEGRVIFVDAFLLSAQKTKEAKASLASLARVKGFDDLATRKNNAALVALGTADAHITKSFRNMNNVMVEESRNLNPVDVLNYRFLVVANPEASIEVLAARMK